MKSLSKYLLETVGLLSVLVSTSQAIQADWDPGKHMAKSMIINLALGKSIQQNSNYGFCDTCYLGAFIQPGNNSFITTQLEEGRGYLFAGAVEEGNDLDITIEDQNGNRFARDTKTDNIPFVEFVPPQTGMYTVRLKLHSANSAEFCGMVLMQKGGWNLPLENLGSASARALARCQRVAELTSARFLQEPGEWAIIGQVMAEGNGGMFSDMRLGHGQRVIVTGTDNKSQDIDLAAYRDGSSRVRLASDTQSDNNPIIRLTTSRDSRYSIETINARSNGPSVVMTALLDID
ncbi:MAG: hypothetical protein ACK5E3_10385 [Planctomycetota bacterium]|jgi:hypothetical protein